MAHCLATIEILAGEERELADCALSHAALRDPIVGSVRLLLDGHLLCSLNAERPRGAGARAGSVLRRE